MKSMASPIVGVLATISAIALGGCSSGVQTPAVGGARAAVTTGDTIVYSSIQPANWDLYLFDEPGTAPSALTTHGGLDYNPVVSPDGRWVVFTSERTGSPDLYVLDLETRGAPRELVAGDAMDDAAAFSPDGRTLAFVSTRASNPDVWVTPFAPEGPAGDAEPVNLTANDAGDYNPVFSPDGTQILFSSSRDAAAPPSPTAGAPGAYEAGELYVMRADGTDVRRLTDDAAWDGSPAWAPDGQSIGFYSQRDGPARIFRMRADGSDVEPVSVEGEAALSPTFDRDGRVVYAARREDRWSIVSARLDGSDPRVESDGARDYWAPAYDPASGRLVAYGPGPLDEATRFESDIPGAFLVHEPREVALPDRTVAVRGIRGYLPTLNLAAGEVAVSEDFARLVVTRLDGTGKRAVFDRAP